MVAPNGMSDFEIMATSPTNVNIPKKVIPSVVKEIQKLRERDLQTHLLETDGLTKPVTCKKSDKENSVRFTRQR